MFNNNVITIAVMGTGSCDHTVSSREDIGAFRGGVIIAIMEIEITCNRVLPPSEAIGQSSTFQRMDERTVEPIR